MHNDKPLKKKKSITLDEDLVEQIYALAQEDDRTFSQFVNRILRQYIEAQAENGTERSAESYIVPVMHKQPHK